MFTRKFDRKVRLALGTFAFSGLLGITFGYYVLWPSNMEAGYEPAQPLAYSHKLHAGDMKIQCIYCHSNADKGAQATVPALTTCMNCHTQVQNPGPAGQLTADMTYLLDHVKRQEPIHWRKVNVVADFVYFEHSRHVNSDIKCQECHGPIETMERVRRQYGEKMSWCLGCHRQPPPKDSHAEQLAWSTRAPTHCVTCHR